MLSFQDVDSCSSHIDDLYSVENDKCLDAVMYVAHFVHTFCLLSLICNDDFPCRRIKNMIIGSNKQKDAIIQQGIVPRLIQLLGDDGGDENFKLEVIAVIGSLACGDENHIKSLTIAGVVPFLLNSKLSRSPRGLCHA